MTIRHVVTWKLSAEDATTKAEHASRIARELAGLADVIPGIQSLQVGSNVLYADSNWDVVLIADFDDAGALDAYQVHPEHKRVGEFIATVRSARAAVDFEL